MPEPEPTAPAPTQPAAEMAEQALNTAEQAVSSLQQSVDPQAFQPQPFEKVPLTGAPKGIDLLGDVNLNVKIELGRTRMLVEDVLRLSEGAVVELDKLAGDPVDVFVNDRHIARGEVLVLNDNFCVRVNEIVQDSGGSELAQRKKPA
jgi:flagellar motor switch protein FliN